MPTTRRRTMAAATSSAALLPEHEGEQHPSKPSKESSQPASVGFTVLQTAAAAVIGLVFGFVLNKSSVYQAGLIRSQFRFRDFTMLKVFLTAAATSILSVTALYRRSDNTTITAVGKSYRDDSGLLSPMLGGLLLGGGMAVSGACPGTIWAQLGAGSVSSLITLSAAFIGGLLWGTGLHSVFAPLKSVWRTPATSLHDFFGKHRTATGLVTAAVLYGIVVALMFVEPSPKLLSPVDAVVWNPVIPGLVIGLLQFPITALLSKNLGCSSSFVTVTAALVTPLYSSDYLVPRRWGMKNWWQVLMVACVALGSFIALKTSVEPSATYDVSHDVTTLQSLLGGLVMVTGARIGNGCTSGHGISGMGHLALRSFLAVASMFIGGIVVTATFF